MTTQEQLKIYAAYLPYNVAFSDLTCDMPNKLILDTENFSGVLEDANHLNTIRLHLYDLSHFEKYFAKHFDEDIDVRTFLNEGFITEENQFESISDMINNYKVEWWPYGVIQLALKHHFNVFGIPAGDFIDKATLKTESNDKY